MTINDFGPLEPTKINKAEKELSIKLPSDYVDFLINKNGGVLEKDDNNKILIPAIDQYIVLADCKMKLDS